MVNLYSWEHQKTDEVDMMYLLMDLGDSDLFKVISSLRRNKTLSLNKVRFFWEGMLLVSEALIDSPIFLMQLIGNQRGSQCRNYTSRHQA